MSDAKEIASIEESSDWVKANVDRIDNAVRDLVTVDGRSMAAFVLLMPIKEGTQMVANVPTGTAMTVMRACLASMQLADLKAFLGEVLPVIDAAIAQSEKPATKPH